MHFDKELVAFALSFALLFRVYGVVECEWCVYELAITILLLNFTVNICKIYSHPFLVCFVFLLSFIVFSWLSSALVCNTRNGPVFILELFCWSFVFVIWWFIILLVFIRINWFSAASLKLFLWNEWFMWTFLKNTIFPFILWVGV